MPGELPTEVYVRFLDPNVGKLSKVPVDGHNEMQIKSLAKSSQIYSIDAEHAILESRGQIYANIKYNEVPERLIPQDDKDCAVLPRILRLAVGARLMLR